MAVNEYICRVIDQTDGKEPVPQSAQEAQNTTAGKASTINNSPNKTKEVANKPKTGAIFNSALQVGMPVFNAFTQGVGGQAIGMTRQLVQLYNSASSVAQQGIGALVAPTASIAAAVVGMAVSEITAAISKNNAIAKGIQNTNDLRASVGLSTVGFSQRGITRRVKINEVRG